MCFNVMSVVCNALTQSWLGIKC